MSGEAQDVGKGQHLSKNYWLETEIVQQVGRELENLQNQLRKSLLNAGQMQKTSATLS